MNEANIVEINLDHYQVTGNLNFYTVPDVLTQGQKILLTETTEKKIVFDFSTVTQCDSSGVALLLEWMRSAHQQQKEISFINLPPPMQATARVCEVDHLLGIQNV